MRNVRRPTDHPASNVDLAASAPSSLGPEEIAVTLDAPPPLPPSPLDRVLAGLRNVTFTGTGYKALCPAHPDTDPSLSIAEGEDGRVLLHCFADCEPEKIVKAIGLTMRDLFPSGSRRPGDGEEGEADPPGSPETLKPAAGLTLARYAAAKQLPIDFLQGRGLTEISYRGAPAVRIPYLDQNGIERAVRFRLGLTGPDRFRWRKGSKPLLYGLESLADARRVGKVVLVEGESDQQTLALHGIPALGLPGAGMWKEEWAALLEGIPRVEVVLEPDAGGVAMLKWLGQSRIRDQVYLVTLRDSKDVSEQYLKDPVMFDLAMRDALDAGVPWREWADHQAALAHQDAWLKCEELATSPSILDRLVVDLRRQGLVGEEPAAKLVYLAVTSRFGKRPVSCVVTGPSSAGKSHVVQVVLSLVPASACYVLTAMSERALAYSTESLVHRMLVLYEAAGLSGDFQSYLIRSLLSEGRLSYETVQKIDGRLEAKRMDREGPTGLIMTTTMTKLHQEIETRLLAIPVSDTAAQTKAVLQELARQHTDLTDSLSDVPAAWHALHDWLAGAEHRVVIPYAGVLAELIRPVAVRLRRDFGALLALVETHALLHQATRQKNAAGLVVADLQDYAVVRALIQDVLAESVKTGVTSDIREIVATVAALGDLPRGGGEPYGVKISVVGRELGLDEVSAWRRVQRALKRGFVRNLEERKYREARLVVGDPLPEEADLLPSPELVEQKVSGLQPNQEGSPPPPSLPEPLQDQTKAPARRRRRKQQGDAHGEPTDIQGAQE